MMTGYTVIGQVPIGTDKTDTKRFTVPFVLQLKLLERIIQIQKY